MDELIELMSRDDTVIEFNNFDELNDFFNYINNYRCFYDIRFEDNIDSIIKYFKENFNKEIIAFINENNKLIIDNRYLVTPNRRKNIIKYKTFTAVINYDFKKLKTNLQILKEKFNKIEKEKDVMDILDLYYKRESEKIDKKNANKIEENSKKDEIQAVVTAMLSQINIILENENSDKILDNNIGKLSYLVTKQTKSKNTMLIEEKDKELCELKNKVLEIRTLLDMAENYEQKIDILKSYEILDKKGKFINQ